MRIKKLLRWLLPVEQAVIEDFEFGPSRRALVVHVRRRKGAKLRCPHCGRAGRRYDRGDGRRQWRCLDLAKQQVFLEAEAVRIRCEEHGVVVASVPWSRHRARFTRTFEQQAAWLATKMDRTALSELMRISWRTVGRILQRVTADEARDRNQLDGLRRIGIDEISYRKRHKYLTVVLDHETGRVVWAAEGRRRATVEAFLDELGPSRCAQLEVVSADAAAWIINPVKARCPNAVVCMDPFHVVQWANRSLDELRRAEWRRIRQSKGQRAGVLVQRDRFMLWKDPSKLTPNQAKKLAQLPKINRALYRGYLIKEQLREVFRQGGQAGVALLDRWLKWAQRSRLKPFVELNRKIRRHRARIDAALRYGVSNARSESANTRIRLLIRQGFGFHSAQAVIALVMLKLGGLCPPLPGRT